MKNRLYTLLFLLLAIVLYVLGMAIPAAILLVLGVMAELVFWVRLFGGRRHKTDR